MTCTTPSIPHVTEKKFVPHAFDLQKLGTGLDNFWSTLFDLTTGYGELDKISTKEQDKNKIFCPSRQLFLHSISV
jgi:hypothetical protein